MLPFVDVRHLKIGATELFAQVKNIFEEHSFTLDQSKFEVAWTYRSERPGIAFKQKARSWSPTVEGKVRRLDPQAQGPRWPGFRVDP
jgi:hypothetical protein